MFTPPQFQRPYIVYQIHCFLIKDCKYHSGCLHHILFIASPSWLIEPHKEFKILNVFSFFFILNTFTTFVSQPQSQNYNHPSPEFSLKGLCSTHPKKNNGESQQIMWSKVENDVTSQLILVITCQNILFMLWLVLSANSSLILAAWENISKLKLNQEVAHKVKVLAHGSNHIM